MLKKDHILNTSLIQSKLYFCGNYVTHKCYKAISTHAIISSLRKYIKIFWDQNFLFRDLKIIWKILLIHALFKRTTYVVSVIKRIWKSWSKICVHKVVLEKEWETLSIRLDAEWLEKKQLKKSRKSPERVSDTLLCEKICVPRSRLRETWRRSASSEGISRRPRGIQSTEAQKSTI